MVGARYRYGTASVEIDIVDYIDVIPTTALVAELEARARSEPKETRAATAAGGFPPALAIQVRDLLRRRLLVEAEAMLDEIIDERGVWKARSETAATEYARLFAGGTGRPA